MDFLTIYDREGNGYPLDPRNPADLQLWERLSDPDYRRVGQTEVGEVEGEVYVSTVLLNHDHGYGDGPPIIFETMVFGGDLDGECWRYSTEAEAIAGHEAVVTLVSLALAVG